MARKKVVFVFVEGPSDAEALDAVISKIFDKDTVHVHIEHGDITTEQGVISSNIVTKVGNAVRDYAKANHYTKDNFKEIVHIVDTDGAYIPDSQVIQDSTVKRPVYSLSEIRAFDKKKLEKRNAQKSLNLDKLCTTNRVYQTPYHVYYMSCNLDHVLYNKLNSSDEEKEHDAFQFAKKYREDIPGFLAYIMESEFSVMTGYRESWTYIKQGLHSLERFTNLGLCFQNEMNKNAEEEIISSE